jgi:ABC-type phosphate transport system substrate-binding protein
VKFPFVKNLILTLSLSLSLIPIGARATSDIVVIVNQKNPVTAIMASELEDYFMKRNRMWPNGTAVRFFDQRDENETRKIFLKKFVKKTSREIELYWIGEKIYTGNIAPIQITSDSMVTSMVSRFPGGIGYVSSKYKIPKNIKTIVIKKD